MPIATECSGRLQKREKSGTVRNSEKNDGKRIEPEFVQREAAFLTRVSVGFFL